MKKNDTKGFLESLMTSIEDDMTKNLFLNSFGLVLKDIKENENINEYFNEDGEVNQDVLLSRFYSLSMPASATCVLCRVSK